MSPTINKVENKDDKLKKKIMKKSFVVIKVINKQTQLDRGDIVSFISPDDPNERLVKRIIGLGGDRVQINSKQKYVDIPPGRCWVEGSFYLFSFHNFFILIY
jgi:signal peptidase I